MIKTIIFDFDGVIANTDEGRYKLLKDILPTYGLDFAISDYNKMIGLSTKSFLKRNYSELTEKEINLIVSERHKLYFENLDRYCIPFNGMTDIVEKFSHYFQLIVATTNATENVIKQMDFLNISQYFNYVFGREVMENTFLLKDYQNLASRPEFNVKESIVIEDSETGILSAKKSGYACIEFNSKEKTKNENSDYCVNNYYDLYNLVLKLKLE
ncbi:MAG: hypothetical protein A2W99_03855 [Bacteroidetes bacterium GWF2_33_16]|nr:MAG: hypothetical protein A2X00_12265 [Bacteroidetes bacterium GWE2_32_14]OFY03628.1 MAG: hypothetical protein A2W99_03855 [Bacteroidetes bacterium GWF2_33_16]